MTSGKLAMPSDQTSNTFRAESYLDCLYKGLFFGHAPPSNTKMIKMLFLNYFHSVPGKFPYQNKCTKMPQEV